MHEFSLMADLMGKIESVARTHGSARVVSVTVKLGALCHVSPEHFREHFVHATKGTVAEEARLYVETIAADDPNAQEVLLESVELEESEQRSS